ncbi:MAG: hypothetical protein IT249_04015 [Chitinophagaceae bacterium]|nr:hypothetical protein [Chitinophagaceae bacterium]
MRIILTLAFVFFITVSHAQKRNADTVVDVPGKYTGSVDHKIQSLNRQLSKQTEKYLNNLSRQEEKLRKQLAKIDSSKAAEIFGDVKKRYAFRVVGVRERRCCVFVTGKVRWQPYSGASETP